MTNAPVTPRGAVFLSYASQDAEAAQRIAELLRAAGVEVWLDQHELRGGDEWDASIRRQIKTCALFVPIISAHTQSRREGYFRREWNLAVERTFDMAQGTPFLVPVVTDDTPEAKALVPEQFRRIQWTRLREGRPDGKFVAQVQRLLAAQAAPATTAVPFPVAPAAPAASRAPGKPRVVLLLALLAAAGVAAFLLLRAPELQVDARAVAVLPFSNLSDDRENAHFADGIQEDILTHLSHEKSLRVVSRTSVMAYRSTQLHLREIATRLNAAYLLEGSVRGRAGRVRISVQLIDARTDAHVWAKTYDSDLTDVFTAQTELASQIAQEMRAHLSSR